MIMSATKVLITGHTTITEVIEIYLKYSLKGTLTL